MFWIRLAGAGSVLEGEYLGVVFHYRLCFRRQWDIQVKIFGGLKGRSCSFHIEGTGGEVGSARQGRGAKGRGKVRGGRACEAHRRIINKVRGNPQ